MMKLCRICKKELPLTCFYKHTRGKFGVRSYCKECTKHKDREEYCSKQGLKRKQRRVQAITAYGGKCVVCGDSYIEHLTIDHINGNGHEERKIWKNSNAMYLELERRKYPKDNYQLLCWNCNTSKYYFGISAVQARQEMITQTQGLYGDGI